MWVLTPRDTHIASLRDFGKFRGCLFSTHIAPLSGLPLLESSQSTPWNRGTLEPLFSLPHKHNLPIVWTDFETGDFLDVVKGKIGHFFPVAIRTWAVAVQNRAIAHDE